MRIEVKPGFWITAALWLLLVPLQLGVGVLLAAAVHELGHMAAVRITGGRVRALELGPGGARMTADEMGRGAELLCTLAGPVAGGMTVLLWRWYPELAVAGLVQTVFNLLPVYPLDGGRVVRNICCKSRDFGVQ